MLWIERRALPRLSFHVNWFFACQPNTFCRWLWSNGLSSPSWIHDVNNFFHSFYFVGDKFKKKINIACECDWMLLPLAAGQWDVICKMVKSEREMQLRFIGPIMKTIAFAGTLHYGCISSAWHIGWWVREWMECVTAFSCFSRLLTAKWLCSIDRKCT